ncbi:MAG TPA: pseudouridine synthase, partial [Nitrospirota bacterium]
MLERIQKIISAAGVTSRRAAEELITEGRVRLNGQVVTELGTKADASKDHIKVDGKLINPKQPQTYVMLNKPAGFVTTMSDPEGRPTVQDLLKGVKVRVYPVGRLDYNTEGMLLMTNDGDFAHLITHPKHELPKTYLAKLKGVLDEKAIDALETGVFLEDGKTAPAKLKKVRKEEANSWVEITIHEGRKRQVRRMFDRVGRSVIKLKRIKTGSLVLGDLPEGGFRYLTQEEVRGLREMALKERGTGPAPRVKVPAAGDEVRRPAVRADLPEMEARGPKPAHRGPRPDMRPWKLEEKKKDEERGAMSGIRRGRLGARAMQDTGGGRRKNQVVKPRTRADYSGGKGPGAATGFGPRRESSSRPAFRPSPKGPLSGTASARPSRGAVTIQSDAGRRQAAFRTSPGGPTPRTASARPARGAAPWKSDARAKPA